MKTSKCRAKEISVYCMRVGTRGRITLPLAVRQLLGVASGDIVELTDDGTTLWLVKGRS